MNTSELLSSVESEIATLQQVRAVLAGQDGYRPTSERKWTMSAEARAKIAAAQRKRWAKQKRVAKKAA